MSMHVKAMFSIVAIALMMAASTGTQATPGIDTPTGGPPPVKGVRLLDDGGFEVDVTLDVYLLGFEPEVAQALQERMGTTRIEHGLKTNAELYATDHATDGSLFASNVYRPTPARPIVSYEIHDMDARTDAAFFEALPGWAVQSAPGQYDGRTAEAWIASALQDEKVRLDPLAPVLVIMHTGDAIGDHTWRYWYDTGYVDQVRIFGENEPFMVLDASALEDPFSLPPDPAGAAQASAMGMVTHTDPDRQDYPYLHPLPASGTETVDALAGFIPLAAEYRFFKGSQYPVSTRSCHHVTAVLAIESTAVTNYGVLGFKHPTELMDLPLVEESFERLTQEDVEVEMKVLMLPQDEPVLAALLRSSDSLVTIPSIRSYLAENFDTYVDSRSGCEEYLSFHVYRDNTNAVQPTVKGVGTFEAGEGRRISWSWNPEWYSMQWDEALPLADELGRATDVYKDYVNPLLIHEAGHLFGLAHTQSIFWANGTAPPSNPSFISVASVMGPRDPQLWFMNSFTMVDQSTWQLGRASMSIQEARELGLENTPVFHAALRELADNDWVGAYEELAPYLNQS